MPVATRATMLAVVLIRLGCSQPESKEQTAAPVPKDLAIAKRGDGPVEGEDQHRAALGKPKGSASEVPAAVRDFTTWLGGHSEVTVASLIHDTPISRIRYSNATETVVGGAYKGRAVCIRHPVPVRYAWSLPYLRRADGRPVRGLALGPLPGDEHHAAAYEFRFPEATAHARNPQPLKYANGHPFIEYGSEARSAPPSEPGLPTVLCPSWAVDESLSIGHVNAGRSDESILNLDGGSGEQVLCSHTPGGWRCFPPVKEPLVDEVEPAVPPQDRRLPKEGPARLVDALVRCDADDMCLLLLEWAWYRERIAHTYRWEGSFITLHRVHGDNIQTSGRMRTRIRAQDNQGRDFRGHLQPNQLTPSCFELSSVPRPEGLWPDSRMKPPPSASPYALPPAGQYCITVSGLCHKGGTGSDPSGLPGCA